MKIGVTGCAGRMGKMLCQAVIEAGLELSGGTERPESPVIGQGLGKGKVFADIKELYTANVGKTVSQKDIIDIFSRNTSRPVKEFIESWLAGKVHIP